MRETSLHIKHVKGCGGNCMKDFAKRFADLIERANANGITMHAADFPTPPRKVENE